MYFIIIHGVLCIPNIVKSEISIYTYSPYILLFSAHWGKKYENTFGEWVNTHKMLILKQFYIYYCIWLYIFNYA